VKIRFKNGQPGVGRTLSLEADRGDELAYVDAERVHRGDLDPFIPFTYDHSGKGFEFTYYLGECLSISQILKAPLSPEFFRNALGSLLHMMQVCETNGLSRMRVMHSCEHVFYNPLLGTLAFVYVPLRSYVASQGEADLISRICSAPMADASDQQFAVALWDFAHRTTLMTSVALETFLQRWGMQTSRTPNTRTRRASAVIGIDHRADYGWDFVRQARQAGQDIPQSGGAVSSSNPESASSTSGNDAEPNGAAAVANTAGSPLGPTAQPAGSPERHRGKAAEKATPPLARESISLKRLSTGMVYEFGKGAFVIGRSSDCTLSLPDAIGVSRKHASIGYDGKRCTLRDLGSKNGIFIDGKRIAPDDAVPLSIGSRFALGEEQFQLL